MKYGVQIILGPRPLRFKVKFRVALMRVESKSYCTVFYHFSVIYVF